MSLENIDFNSASQDDIYLSILKDAGVNEVFIKNDDFKVVLFNMIRP